MIIFQVFSSCKNKSATFNGVVYQNVNKNYGYAIYFKKKVVIIQERIPALAGDIAFKDSVDALKVMDLVIEKLNKGLSPTVNNSELKRLNIKMR